MRALTKCFVALARTSNHEALLHHLLGDWREEEHCHQLVRHYMDSARNSKTSGSRTF